MPTLETLFERGIANGVQVRRLDAEEAQELEPHVQCLSAFMFHRRELSILPGSVPGSQG